MYLAKILGNSNDVIVFIDHLSYVASIWNFPVKSRQNRVEELDLYFLQESALVNICKREDVVSISNIFLSKRKFSQPQI